MTSLRHPGSPARSLLAFVALALAPLALAAGGLAPGAVAAEAEPAATPPTNAVTWGVRPADTEHGTDRPNYAYGLEPGGTLSDAMIVSNYDDEPQTFRVYAADGFVTDAGQLDLLTADQESTQLGSWVAFDAPEVTVAAGESVTVPFRISIPAEVTPGDYAAGVVSSIRVDAQSGVSVDRRLGSRMFVRVGGELAPQLRIDGLTVDYSGGLNPFAPGSATIGFTVTNVGNTRIAAGGAVDVEGLFGLGRVAAEPSALGELPELLPGASAERTVVVDGVWPLLIATAGVELNGTIVSADFGPAAVDPASVPAVPTASASTTVPAVPVGALAILALLIGLVVLQRVRVRRRKALEEQRVAAAVASALAASAEPELEPALR